MNLTLVNKEGMFVLILVRKYLLNNSLKVSPVFKANSNLINNFDFLIFGFISLSKISESCLIIGESSPNFNKSS